MQHEGFRIFFGKCSSCGAVETGFGLYGQRGWTKDAVIARRCPKNVDIKICGSCEDKKNFIYNLLNTMSGSQANY